MVEHDGAPLIVSGGTNGLQSCRVDGTSGPLHVDTPPITALAVVAHHGPPVLITGGLDGRLRSWRLDAALRALATPGAHAVHVRDLSVGSMEVVLLLAIHTAEQLGLGVAIWKLPKILDAIKRVAGFPAELRLQSLQAKANELVAEAEVIEAELELSKTKERHRAAQAARQRDRLRDAGWRTERVVVTTEDDL